ncbi:MAG: hypothetical protein ACD_68C00123G0003 [uncultured bacterium]|nr:MAG: hypothetical protein ACD_68C00123G0003 [uncultured bacterium]
MTNILKKPDWLIKAGGIVVNLLIWFLAYIWFSNFQEMVVLHYNVYFGIDVVDVWWRILFLPLTGLVIWLINIALASLLFKKNKESQLIINCVSLLVQIVLLIALVFTWLANNYNSQ